MYVYFIFFILNIYLFLFKKFKYINLRILICKYVYWCKGKSYKYICNKIMKMIYVYIVFNKYKVNLFVKVVKKKIVDYCM